MTTISFQVFGDPKGQPRPRAFAMKLGNGKYSARVFDAGTAEGWKSTIALEARKVLPAVPMLGPIAIRVAFIFRRPKFHFRANGELKPSAPRHHTQKPDGDNLIKAVCDTLTQIRFWHDDAQVCEMSVLKSFGELPGCGIEVRELSP